MILNPSLHQLVQTIGDNPVEGQVKIIERKATDGSKYNQGPVTHVYITLNKGMTHPDEMFFEARKVRWRLLKCPVSGIEPREDKKNLDIYGCIDKNDMAAMKLLKPRSLNKQPKTKDEKQQFQNPLGYALANGSLEAIQFLYDSGMEFLPSTSYYRKASSPFDHLLSNEKVDFAIVFKLFIDYGFDPSEMAGNTLSDAAMSGNKHLKAFNVILNHNPSLVTKTPRSCMGSAAYNGQGKFCKLLMEHGIFNFESSLIQWGGKEHKGFAISNMKKNGVTYDQLIAFEKHCKSNQ